jgi:DNA ligase (NAD+)
MIVNIKMKSSMYQDLRKDPIQTLNSLSIKEIVKILETADTSFFNTDETLFDDDMYDIIKNYLREKDPNNSYLKKIGADIHINKKTLPFYLGSLDKIKDDENEIIKWTKKYTNDYIISEKLDGISCLLYINGKSTQLFTRGNGYEGQDISHILSHLNLDLSQIKDTIAIRGELIIPKSEWDESLGSNARNVVAGALHSKRINRDIMKRIKFIAYDMMHPRQPLSISLDLLDNLGLPTVKRILITKGNLDINILSEILQDWRKTSLYEIDGIVVQDNGVHKISPGKNPKYAFAFKSILTNQTVEVIVTDVEWNISKHRLLKPLIKFNQVVLSGVKIKQATGFNAKYITNNNIGPGSRLIIIRSGDVIPHILSVLSKSSNGEPKMPNEEYIWNGEYDIVLKGEEKNREHDISSFIYFMNTLSVKGVKEGVITKFYDDGYDTLKKIINMTVEDIMKIEGFKIKSAKNIYDELQNIKEVECRKLLAASSIFGRGFGERKIKMILDVFPFIVIDKERTLSLTVDEIKSIKGMAMISAEQFVNNLPKFMEFYEDLGIKCQTSKKDDQNDGKMKDKKIVFSGFRNKEWESKLQENGGMIATSVSKNIDYLVVKDKNESSSKIKKARELGVTIISCEEFSEKI